MEMLWAYILHKNQKYDEAWLEIQKVEATDLRIVGVAYFSKKQKLPSCCGVIHENYICERDSDSAEGGIPSPIFRSL